MFKNPLKIEIGVLAQLPDTMRQLDRKRYDGLVMDDIRDLDFVVRHREKLQGKYDALAEFATTPGGQCAFCKDLFKLPVVATINNSTRNLQYLLTDDFVSNKDNVVLLSFRGRPGGV